jgi:hypothetical protein
MTNHRLTNYQDSDASPSLGFHGKAVQDGTKCLRCAWA